MMKRTAVLAALAIALAATAMASPSDTAKPTSSTDTVVAGPAPTADAAAAQRKAAPQPSTHQVQSTQPASGDREFYALMAASLLAIGALFWRRRGSTEEG